MKKWYMLGFWGILVALLLSPIQVYAETIPIEIFGWHFGEVNSQNFSLPVITIIVSFVDGFNPCAMWVLLFLISLLLEMEERWKRWYLGLIFLGTSGISYFLFLTSWLQINEFIGLIPITRALIAIAAWIVGLWSINEYVKNRSNPTGCKVSEGEDRQKLFTKIRRTLQKQNIWLASLGIIALAFSVNLFELLCSAALPATYTNILASQEVGEVTKFGYLGLYVLVFMLDDLLIFTIAMITLQTTGLTTRYNNLIKLVSGMIMLALALWITIEVMQGFGII